MKQFSLIVMLFVMMIATYSVADANTSGVEHIRLFSKTAGGTQKSVAMATEKLNNEIDQWLNNNPTLKIIGVEFENTSTGNLPNGGLGNNTVFVTITVVVHCISKK